jgi:MoxR-like ATPase
MQEQSCTVRGRSHPLPSPFFVLATQNPIELEGTYPLPEAQLDRFLLNAVLDYLSAEEETRVIERTTVPDTARIEAVTDGPELLAIQELVRRVPISETVARYAVDVVRATRHQSADAPQVVKKYVSYGASVRAAQFIVLAAKARALSQRRYHVAYEDIAALAIPVLRHRILLSYHAEAQRLSADDILRQVLEQLPPPRA